MQQTRLDETPELIVKPGLHEIKQCELYFKYHPVIPEEYHADLCPKPANDVINHVKQTKSKKGKEKRHGKKRAHTQKEGVMAMVSLELTATAQGEAPAVAPHAPFQASASSPLDAAVPSVQDRALV